MRLLNKILVMSAASIMTMSSVSCFDHEKVKDDSDVENELENKYGMDFELIFHSGKDSDNNEYFNFRDEKGVEFKVSCTRNYNIAADSRIEYTDDYISEYLKKYGDEYISELNDLGIKADIRENYDLGIYVDEYSQIDVIFEKIKDIAPVFVPQEKTYISSRNPVSIYHSGDDVLIGEPRFGKDVTQEKYVKLVRSESINEKLPEEAMRKYPEEFLTLYINGKEFTDKNNVGGVQAHYLEAIECSCIEFKGVYAESSENIREFTGLKEFIEAIFEKKVNEVYDMNVVYENKDGKQELKKPAEHYYDWGWGRLDVLNDDLDMVDSRLRLYEDDIKRIFGAEWFEDPVFTGRLTIDKQ